MQATRKEDPLMYSRKFGLHGMISAFVAFTILGLSALILDRGYLIAAPAGVVDVKVEPIQPLDEVVVVGDR